jgi:hypothetical protein
MYSRAGEVLQTLRELGAWRLCVICLECLECLECDMFYVGDAPPKHEGTNGWYEGGGKGNSTWGVVQIPQTNRWPGTMKIISNLRCFLDRAYQHTTQHTTHTHQCVMTLSSSGFESSSSSPTITRRKTSLSRTGTDRVSIDGEVKPFLSSLLNYSLENRVPCVTDRRFHNLHRWRW